MLQSPGPQGGERRRASPPPLWGRDRVGGSALPRKLTPVHACSAAMRRAPNAAFGKASGASRSRISGSGARLSLSGFIADFACFEARMIVDPGLRSGSTAPRIRRMTRSPTTPPARRRCALWGSTFAVHQRRCVSQSGRRVGDDLLETCGVEAGASTISTICEVLGGGTPHPGPPPQGGRGERGRRPPDRRNRPRSGRLAWCENLRCAAEAHGKENEIEFLTV